jgi:hypothetical protein
VKGKANVYREFVEALKEKLDGGEKKTGAKRGKK